MKAHVLKLISVVVLTVCLIVSFCSVPVSAAEDYTSVVLHYPMAENHGLGYAKYETSFENNDWASLRHAVWFSDQTNYVDYEWTPPTTYDGKGFLSFYLGATSFDTGGYFASAGSLWVDPFKFTYDWNIERAAFLRYRISVRSMLDGAPTVIVGRSSWVDGYYTANSFIDVPRTFVTLPNTVTAAGLGLFIDFEFSYDSAESLYITTGILDNAVNFNYAPNGLPASIPQYTEPSGTDIVDENSSLEQDILNSDTVQDVETNTVELFASLDGSLLNFRDGVLFVTRCLNIYLVPTSDEDGWFHDLVQISLALGIVATLLGITGSIIGAAVKRRGD